MFFYSNLISIQDKIALTLSQGRPICACVVDWLSMTSIRRGIGFYAQGLFTALIHVADLADTHMVLAQQLCGLLTHSSIHRIARLFMCVTNYRQFPTTQAQFIYMSPLLSRILVCTNNSVSSSMERLTHNCW